MPLQGHRAVMRIDTDERAKGEHGPLHTAIVETARHAGLAGATLPRGSVGFGIGGDIQRAGVLDISRRAEHRQPSW